MRAWPFLARTFFRYGGFLSTRPSDAERRLGVQHLREGEQLARRLGMTRLATDIGRTNKDVSLVLAISLNTVATHVRNILNKTQCANRTEAATYAIRHGLHTAPSGHAVA